MTSKRNHSGRYYATSQLSTSQEWRAAKLSPCQASAPLGANTPALVYLPRGSGLLGLLLGSLHSLFRSLESQGGK